MTRENTSLLVAIGHPRSRSRNSSRTPPGVGLGREFARGYDVELSAELLRAAATPNVEPPFPIWLGRRHSLG